LGILKRVEDSKGNITNMTYDWLGRKKAMTDPDMGSWSYDYDNNGNLTSQMDAKGQTIFMVYDALNRLTNKTYTGGPGMNNVRYSYDSGVNGLGRRTGMNDYVSNPQTPEIYDYAYAYDARGRLTSESKVIDSVTCTTGYSYDYADRVYQITYPITN
jgi:YD repeat-containing protein